MLEFEEDDNDEGDYFYKVVFFSLVISIYFLDKSCGDDFFDIEERNGDETTTKAETKPDVVAAEDEAAAEKIKKLNITAKEFVPPVHSWNTVPVIFKIFIFIFIFISSYSSSNFHNFYFYIYLFIQFQ